MRNINGEVITLKGAEEHRGPASVLTLSLWGERIARDINATGLLVPIVEHVCLGGMTSGPTSARGRLMLCLCFGALVYALCLVSGWVYVCHFVSLSVNSCVPYDAHARMSACAHVCM